MRTTLTLDDQVASRLQELAHRSGKSFKAAVNETLRLGLEAQTNIRQARPYRVEPVNLGGALPGIDLHKALELADELEDEEIRRELEMRK